MVPMRNDGDLINLRRIWRQEGDHGLSAPIDPNYIWAPILRGAVDDLVALDLRLLHTHRETLSALLQVAS